MPNFKQAQITLERFLQVCEEAVSGSNSSRPDTHASGSPACNLSWARVNSEEGW